MEHLSKENPPYRINCFKHQKVAMNSGVIDGEADATLAAQDVGPFLELGPP